jgi:hypothetical protein
MIHPLVLLMVIKGAKNDYFYYSLYCIASYLVYGH